MTKKTILLTGATGYLGSELLKYWLSLGHQSIILKRSTSNLYRIENEMKSCTFYDVDTPGWQNVFSDHKIDAVVHTAASYGRKGETFAEVVEANSLFPVKLLDLAINASVPYFINTASSLPKTINDYSLSKAHFQDWLNQKKGQIHTINMVLEYFYGPGDDDWKFISMVVKKLLNNESSIDFTSGQQKRDFIYIDDVISAYDIVLDNLDVFPSGTNVPLGSGESYTLRSVVELSKKVLNNSSTYLNFGAIPDRNGELLDQKADVSILKKLGWKINFPLEKGLNQYKL